MDRERKFELYSNKLRCCDTPSPLLSINGEKKSFLITCRSISQPMKLQWESPTRYTPSKAIFYSLQKTTTWLINPTLNRREYASLCVGSIAAST